MFGQIFGKPSKINAKATINTTNLIITLININVNVNVNVNANVNVNVNVNVNAKELKPYLHGKHSMKYSYPKRGRVNLLFNKI